MAGEDLGQASGSMGKAQAPSPGQVLLLFGDRSLRGSSACVIVQIIWVPAQELLGKIEKIVRAQRIGVRSARIFWIVRHGPTFSPDR